MDSSEFSSDAYNWKGVCKKSDFSVLVMRRCSALHKPYMGALISTSIASVLGLRDH